MDEPELLFAYGRRQNPVKKRGPRLNVPFPRQSFDFELEQSFLLRRLSVHEKEILQIFESYFQEHGKFIPKNSTLSNINKTAKKLGIETVFTQEEIDDYLFVDLFPHNIDIPFRTAVRRLMGFDGTVHEPAESLAVIRFASDLLTLDQKAGKPVIPSTGDIKRLSRSSLFVPGLFRRAPDATRILGNFPGESWPDIVAKAMAVSNDDLLASLRSPITFDDAVESYKIAFSYYYPQPLEPDVRLVTVEMLSDYDRKFGTKFASRIGRLIARMRNAEDSQDFTLDDIRRAARCPVSNTLAVMELRKANAVGAGKEIKRWDKANVAASYRMLWLKKQETQGLSCDPPMPKEINAAVKIQTRILNEFGTLNSAQAKQAAAELGVPSVLIPTVPTINKVFGGMPELLGFVERISGAPITINKALSLRGIVRGANQRNVPHSRLPQCVVNKLKEQDVVPSGSGQSFDSRI